jgi:hypothetical protein
LRKRRKATTGDRVEANSDGGADQEREDSGKWHPSSLFMSKLHGIKFNTKTSVTDNKYVSK